MKRSSGEQRVGHVGTLDPLASGVLPVLFGRATRVAEYVAAGRKTYVAGIRFGAGSSTDDAEGRMEEVERAPELDPVTVEKALQAFVGEVDQIPPAYSAIKVDGQRSYTLARQADAGGASAPALPPRRVRVYRLTLLRLEPGQPGPLAMVEVESGSGFYVRALARDLGLALGTRAYLETLVRSRVGSLDIADARELETAEAAGGELGAWLLPASSVLLGLPRVEAADDQLAALRDGKAIEVAGETGKAWAAGSDGRVLALGAITDGRFQPHRLIELQ